MSQQPIDDSGEFNDSIVYLHPVRFTDKGVSLSRPANTEQLHLGIYESIKLSPLLRAKQGKVVELVTLDVPSRHAFATEEGESLLRQYATSEVAFVMVAGNRSVGKSFFCDKVLNLCQVRGNHFCRSKNTGINLWSSPFEKGDLKIFLLQINGCAIQSQEFKILLTYAIMIGSAFVVIDDLKAGEHSALEQFDFMLTQIVDQITPSKLEESGKKSQRRSVFLPEFFYFLRRNQQKKENSHLSIVNSFIEERLPDALVTSYQGDQTELVHLPFLDTKCISEEYMRKVSSIFTQLHEVVTEKRYNELTLTGSIVLKIVKYIETYLNGNHLINIEDLYERIIEDLYQSAYNYCILSYHEEMERNFEDQQPKSLDLLISIFEQASSNVLDKFQEFTLDEKYHQLYQQKLERHIDEKELMILDINKLKTQRVINSSYDANDITDYPSYKSVIDTVNSQYPTLNHGSALAIGRTAAELFRKMKSVDYKALKEIERLNGTIEAQTAVLRELKSKNEQKSKERSQANKEQEQFYQREKQLEGRKKELRTQIESVKTVALAQPEQITKKRELLEDAFRRNQQRLAELKNGDSRKNREVNAVQASIEEKKANIVKLEKILAELKSGPQAQGKAGGKGDGKKGKEKA